MEEKETESDSPVSTHLLFFQTLTPKFAQTRTSKSRRARVMIQAIPPDCCQRRRPKEEAHTQAAGTFGGDPSQRICSLDAVRADGSRRGGPRRNRGADDGAHS